MLIFRHLSRCYTKYNMLSYLFVKTWHVIGKGPDRFYARPDDLASLNRKWFLGNFLLEKLRKFVRNKMIDIISFGV